MNALPTPSILETSRLCNCSDGLHLVQEALAIAIEASRSVVEVECRHIRIDQVDWYDTQALLLSADPSDQDYAQHLLRAVRFLDRLSLIVHHPEKAHLVSFQKGA